ncbi:MULTISPECIES: hypothetical protein [unclassified Pseudomonas]|uniref:hypothetical protein n=1 Tax=unclassified Pseudomonas TaxID=196821 RepID=UPI000A7A818C|nr:MULTISPECIES: hypothetical protein [unclassified Pseudomonas]
MTSETLPSSTAHYEKTDLYGVWYINLNEANSKGVALLVLDQDGTATNGPFKAINKPQQ